MDKLGQRKRDVNRLARRETIVAVARDTFLEVGYAATTMSMIAARVGGSKGTLWAYFPSKEAIFVAVIDDMTASLISGVNEAFRPGLSVRATLVGFAEHFITKLLSPAAIRLQRLVIGESERFPEIGRVLYDRGPRWVLESLAKYLESQMSAGELERVLPTLAARQMLDLILSPQRFLLWSVEPSLTPKETRTHVATAVDFFLRVYGTAAVVGVNDAQGGRYAGQALAVKRDGCRPDE